MTKMIRIGQCAAFLKMGAAFLKMGTAFLKMVRENSVYPENMPS